MSKIISIETQDSRGLVHKITGIFLGHDLNIIRNDEHVDSCSGRFSMISEVVGAFDETAIRRDLVAFLPENSSIGICVKERAELSYGEFAACAWSEGNQVVLFSWNTEEGWCRLCRTHYKESFFQLAHVYQPQKNPFFCGVSSSVIVLNALRLKHGLVPCQIDRSSPEKADPYEGKIKYRLYCQHTYLNEETEKVKQEERIAPLYIETQDHHFSPGLAIHQVREMLEIYRARVELVSVTTYGEEELLAFEQALRRVLAETEHFMIVNYEGEPLGTATGGHFAPVAAFDEKSRSVLLLDVAAHKNPWYWTPVQHLYRAMNTRDGDHYRGYLIVSDPDGGPTWLGPHAKDE